MNLKSRFSLWRFKREMRPNPQFKADLWRKLEKEGIFTVDSPTRVPIPAWRWGFGLAMGLVLAASSSTGVFAYFSPSVTEGNLLYPIKRGIETAEETIRRTPQSKTRFYLKQLERREAEAEVLQKRRLTTDSLQTQIERIEKKMEERVRLLPEDSEGAALKKKVKARLEKKGRHQKENQPFDKNRQEKPPSPIEAEEQNEERKAKDEGSLDKKSEESESDSSQDVNTQEEGENKDKKDNKKRKEAFESAVRSHRQKGDPGSRRFQSPPFGSDKRED